MKGRPVRRIGGSELAAAETTIATRLRAIIGGSAGNLVEWYDWYAYAAFALYFAPIFFPAGDQTAQLLASAAVFAVGFFARPLGAWLMGLYADRAGRRAALTLSVGMMCFGSLVIAFTPGAATIGIAAPIILLLSRIFQGLSLGGEYGASASYMSEMAGKKHRGFWSSFQYVTLIAGQLVALGVLILCQQLLPDDALAEWGWRIPFVIGAVLAVVVFWMRRRMDETPSYITAKEEAPAEKTGMLTLIREHPRQTLTILGLTAGGSMIFYVYTTYMQKFLVNTSGFTRDQATQVSAGTLFLFMLAQPLSGWLSDKIGRKPMLLIAFGGGALITWPIMTTLENTTSLPLAFCLILAAMLIQTGYTSISGVFKAELFPTNVRALGVALPYALANAAFGGTAEYVALLFKSLGNESWFYVYASGLLALGFLVVATMPDTRRYSKILED
jgi:MHS family alpha-ketoglutarate permease-like MFS transporter